MSLLFSNYVPSDQRSMRMFISNLPQLKRICCEVAELVFIPKTIAKQLVMVIALEIGAVTVNQVLSIVEIIYSYFSSRSRLIRKLVCQQRSTESQDIWMNLAEQIDSIEGNDEWRDEPDCPLYEMERISRCIDDFAQLMRKRDIFDLMFTLRGGIGRNKFGLLHYGLFTKAMAGSKILVETYHNTVCAALDFVCDAPVLPCNDPIRTDVKLAFFNETRHSYGRTALMVSGGAALGFYHVGVIKALIENGLLPRVISGSSAGSIVSAMVGTRTDEECQRDLFQVRGTDEPGHSGKLMLNFFQPLVYMNDKVKLSINSRNEKKVTESIASKFQNDKKIWKHIFSPIIIVRNLAYTIYDIMKGHRRLTDILKKDTEHFRECCKANIGQFTFQEAFDRTGRILNVIVSPQNRSDPPRLLNYLTAPHVVVWSAVVASSSLPGIFEPNKLLVKHADGTERNESTAATRFIDGSMEADVPMSQISEMFNVNHFIVSQANPHAVWIASFGRTHTIWGNPLSTFYCGVLKFLKQQVRGWISNAIELIIGQRVAPVWDTRRGFASQVFTQEYEGRDIDICLYPWASHRSVFSALLNCLSNPSDDVIHSWVHEGERETWKYIPKIKSHMAEEMTLDGCVQRLRKRLYMGLSQEDAESRAESTSKAMFKGHPSFFTSASLGNMKSLGVFDNFIDDENKIIRPELSSFPQNSVQIEPFNEQKVENIRGNTCSESISNSGSFCSGLFLIDGESDSEAGPSSVDCQHQFSGELTSLSREFSDPQISNLKDKCGYIRTSSMSNFYYRMTKDNTNSKDVDGVCSDQKTNQLSLS